MNIIRLIRLLLLLACVGSNVSVRIFAQWVTQTNNLVAGWNAVYLQVDPSYATLDQLVASDANNPITEIWYWQPALPAGQFVDSPNLPLTGSSQWQQWSRLTSSTSPLLRLRANGAYLVRLPANALPYAWKVKGKPTLPTFQWTLTGLNFIGFPTPPMAPPSFDAFVAVSPELQQNGEFYRYPGGELGDTNPIRIVATRTTPVLRDEAYWIRSGETYNHYFGPLQVVQSGTSIRFSANKSQATFRLRNLANVPITVTLVQVNSEAPPAGQPVIIGSTPLLVREPLNTTNLTYGYTRLAAGPRKWDLASAGQVGSEVEVTIGLNRSQMAGLEGDFFASVLRFTDSLGLSQIDMEVSAIKESAVGLWVGNASISYVSQYLKTYAKAADTTEFAALLQRLQLGEGINGYHYEWDSNTGRVLVFGGPDHRTGSYLLDGPIKLDSGTTPLPHSLRLIIHNDGTTSRLLQKVFYGLSQGTNTILATKESLLHSGFLAQAHRISAVHLPLSSENNTRIWNFSGTMGARGSITTQVALAYDDQSSNPFLHTYHPDHDNLDPLFTTQLAQGLESYGVTRQITLTFTPPDDNFNNLASSVQDLSGNYSEIITFQGQPSDMRQFNVLGSFSLKRISDIGTLTTQ